MNLFDAGVPTVDENLTILFEQDDLRIERIVSWHHTTPDDFWYDQPEDEWLVLLQGEAVLRFDAAQSPDKPALRPLVKGEPLLIAAHERHQVAATSAPAIWLCVFHRQRA